MAKKVMKTYQTGRSKMVPMTPRKPKKPMSPPPVAKPKPVAAKGGATKPLRKAQPGTQVNSAGRAYMKYVPGAVASDTLAIQGDARFQQPYYEDDNFTAKKKMLQMTYGNETPDPDFGTQRRNQTPQEVSSYSDYLRKLYGKKTGGAVKKTMTTKKTGGTIKKKK